MANYFVLAETKLDKASPNSQFIVDQYEIQILRDRNKNGMLEKVLYAIPWKIQLIYIVKK